MSRDTLVEKLKTDIARGRVVTIAGTGVSVSACGNQEVEGFHVATWIGLLRHGVKRCQDIGVADEKAARLLTMQIESGEIDFLVSAAETISQGLKKRSPGVFRQFLKESVGALRVKQPDILLAISEIPGVLAALNYDNLIESQTGRQGVDWKEADKTQAVLRGELDNCVLHLHGRFEESDSVVLDLSSYLTVQDDPHASTVLESLAIQRVMMFVGCGGQMKSARVRSHTRS